MTEHSCTDSPVPFPETADIVTSSDDYARRFSGATGAWFLDVQARLTRSLMAVEPGASVLDVGGGHGQLAAPLCSRGYKLTVIGSAPSCETRIAPLTETGACTFRVGNVIDLPFADRAFDAVLCFRLLPHCERWPELVKELCRVARREVIVDYPAITGLNALAPALFSAKQKIEKNTRDWRQFRHEEVIAAFKHNGFAIDRRRGQFFLPMVLHRALRCRTVSRFLEGAFGVLGLRSRFGSPVIARFVRQD